ncbi:ComEC/Rec2 family competence protein, partial [Thermodesulfobacteriota bacterium]
LPIGLTASVVGALWPSLGAWLIAPAVFLVDQIIRCAHFFSELPGSRLPLPNVGLQEFIIACMASFTLLWLLSRPTRRRLIPSLAATVVLITALVISPSILSRTTDLTVVFLNAGKSDATFVQPPGSGGLLIDAGQRNAYFDVGRSIVRPFFQFRGIRSLSGAVITHPQMDHMGGFLSVLERTSTQRLWWNDLEYRPPFLSRIIDAATARDAKLLPGDRTAPPTRIGGADLRFLNAPGGKIRKWRNHQDVNNASAVLRIDFGQVSFLLPGDLGFEGEKELLQSKVPLKATILKVGHHGCKESSSMEFLWAVQPEAAVISCDDYILGKCPDPQVMERLRRVGAQLYWTGRDGTVTIRTDGKGWSAQTGRDMPKQPPK